MAEPDPGQAGPRPWQRWNVPERKLARHVIITVSSEVEQHEKLPTYILFSSFRHNLRPVRRILERGFR